MTLQDFSKVVFYNHGHNGDLHYSREFIKRISKFVSAPCYISHNKPKSLLSDLNLNFIPIVDWNAAAYNSEGWWGSTFAATTNFHSIENDLYINTWIGLNNFKWMGGRESGVGLKNYYAMFSDTVSFFGHTLEEEVEYIPSIDYSFFNVEQIATRQERNIFISNGDVHSGQAKNYDMNPVIIDLARKHPNCDFYVTKGVDSDLQNIFDANLFVGKAHDGGGGMLGGGTNLNEISYLSTKCDLIVGRASGPYCFTHTKQNLFDIKKTFISFSNNMGTAHWAVLSNYEIPNKAEQIWIPNFPDVNVTTPEEDQKTSFEAIDLEITKKYGSK